MHVFRHSTIESFSLFQIFWQRALESLRALEAAKVCDETFQKKLRMPDEYPVEEKDESDSNKRLRELHAQWKKLCEICETWGLWRRGGGEQNDLQFREEENDWKVCACACVWVFNH